MKLISLTQGKFAKVDDEDFEKVNQFKWFYDNGGYAMRCVYHAQGRERIRMHRAIIGQQSNKEIDHINRDGLDNRRSNLRMCTRSQNNQNSRKRDRATSKYKGVYWSKWHRKWVAQIRIDYKTIYLGYFVSEEGAAEAYNEAASKYFGEFANLNKIYNIEVFIK